MEKQWDILEKVAMASVIEQRRARRWKLIWRFSALSLAAAIFASAQFGSNELSVAASDHTAVVVVRGEISDQSMASAANINKALQNAFKAEKSKGVLIYINSPGGSPVQAGQVADELRRLRAKYPDKHAYAVIGDLGASGGYYIASAAEKIIADKASLVGSIGVTAATFGFVELMQHVGIERRSYTSGEHKAFLDQFQPQNEEETAFWQGVLSNTHQQFIESVKAGRGERLVDPEGNKLFTGLIWTGQQALKLGLVDGLGSVEQVAREEFKAEEMVDYTVAESRIDIFARKLGATFGATALDGLAGVAASSTLQLR